MKTTSDAVVFTGKGDSLKILLIKRKNEPFQDFWALPGGFIEPGEDALVACVRELEEETSLTLATNQAIGLKLRKEKFRDPRGEVQSYPFAFYVDKELQVEGKSDALEATWILVKDFPKLAFDHEAIVCEAFGALSGLFTDELKVELPKDFGRFESCGEIVFYGGSFNPWHDGHTECLRQCPVKNLVVMPDFNPWKSKDTRSPFEVLRSTLEKISELGVACFAGFIGLEDANPTINWLEKISTKKVSLLVGEDNFAKFHLWKNYQLILKIVEKIYVLPRHHDHCTLHECDHILNSDKIVFLGDHPYKDLSSTEVRNHAD